MVHEIDSPPFWGPGFLTTASFLAAYLFATASYSRRQLSVNEIIDPINKQNQIRVFTSKVLEVVGAKLKKHRSPKLLQSCLTQIARLG